MAVTILAGLFAGRAASALASVSLLLAVMSDVDASVPEAACTSSVRTGLSVDIARLKRLSEGTGS
jgi:hypothetical protein